MIRIQPVCESSWQIVFGTEISEPIADQVQAFNHLLRERHSTCVVDTIPSYNTLLVVFDFHQIDRFSARELLHRIATNLTTDEDQPALSRLIEVPVLYSPKVGPDLSAVAEHCGLSIDEVIQRHSETLYRAYAIGFSLGFAFLGTTPKELRVPRKRTPRLKIPPGSVALADNQTAVYPSSTPGGWQLIGRTPVTLIDWQSEGLTKIQVGDRVKFRALTEAEFLQQGGTLDGV